MAGKDVKEVDNDYFLIPVKIMDHEGPLTAGFPIENRLLPQGRFCPVTRLCLNSQPLQAKVHMSCMYARTHHLMMIVMTLMYSFGSVGWVYVRAVWPIQQGLDSASLWYLMQRLMYITVPVYRSAGNVYMPYALLCLCNQVFNAV